MLPRSNKNNRIHPDCPPSLFDEVRVAIAAGIARKKLFAKESVEHVVKRECPQVYEIPRREGFELRLDMPENTHKALLNGKIYLQIRRPTLN